MTDKELGRISIEDFVTLKQNRKTSFSHPKDLSDNIMDVYGGVLKDANSVGSSYDKGLAVKYEKVPESLAGLVCKTFR
jgi:hypothetical protein